MTLRKKTLFIIGLTLIGLMIVLYFVSQSILLDDYIHLEQDRVLEDLQRVLNTLDGQLETLTATVADYAWWDDTYQFVTDRNEQYIADNMNDVTLQSADINVALFVNNTRNVVFSRAIENVTAQEVPLELEFAAYLNSDSPLLHLDDDLESKSGIIFVGNRPVLVASLKILTNLAEGPGRGFLMFGQFLDDFRIQKLSESLGMPISVYALERPDLPPDFGNARVNVSLDKPFFVAVLDDDRIGGYALLNDVSGAPALILRAELPRTIYKQGQTTLTYFIVVLFSLGSIFGLIILLLVERNVLIRITSLSQDVRHFGSSDDLSARVKVTGRDELTSLTISVNSMLESIQNAQHKQQQLNHDLQKSLDELADLQSQKDRFFDHAAHEFRTPLTHFRTYLYLLGKRPDRHAEYLPVLEKATTQFGKLLDDILDLARYGRHEVKVNKQFVNFYGLIDAVVDRQHDRANDLKFIVLPAGQKNPLYCKLDSRQMTLAIDRILAHLINETPPGGTVTFEVISTPETITLCLSSDKMQIDAFQASSLFQPFFVASEGGRLTTGLGLTIAKEIVELHKGQIRFDQTGTGNAAFKIFLPLETEYPTRELPTVST